jgi:histone H3/H4
MSNNEIAKGILEVLTEIANKEKRKAVEKNDYFNAFLAQIFESYFKNARKSLD